MAGAPNTRNWKALEITDFIGRNSHLVVTGDVEVTATNQVPKLSVHVPQGINPNILLLDLKIVKSGPIGGQIVFYRQTVFAKRIRPGQYKEVDILYGGRIIKRIRVQRVLSLAARKKKRR
jgi:hypothetical protein